MRRCLHPLARAAWLALCSGAALAQGAAPLKLKLAEELEAPAPALAGRGRSVVLRADELRSRPDLDTVAEGNVELRHDGTVIRADRLSFDNADGTATARGNVRVSRAGNLFRGPELKVAVGRFEGHFVAPEFDLVSLGAQGRAERLDFIDASRSVAHRASYSSCLRDGTGEPDWLLTADRVKLDLDTNEGVAEGARLRFLGTTLIAAPSLSFPLSDARRSGWLPPNLNIDTKSGIELGVPYYWNIAPNRDATLTPTVYARRGLALDAEFRYLETRFEGSVQGQLLPNDRLTGEARWALQFEHQGHWSDALQYDAQLRRVSDDLHWSDFPRQTTGLTPRLLPLSGGVQRRLSLAGLHGEVYGRIQAWQVQQTDDLATAIVSPYQRLPQLGLRLAGALGGMGTAPVAGSAAGAMTVSLESEINRFSLPGNTATALDRQGASVLRPQGWRWHGRASLARSWEAPGWWIRPRLSLLAAAYNTRQAMSDGRRDASLVLPTLSLDGGMVFERESTWFGRNQRQTLEPRFLYLNTPYRAQAALPKFDSAGRNFNLDAIFAENNFTGADRVSDAHQVTVGLTTRLLDPASGAETLRLGVAQRLLFRDQRVTPGIVNDQGFEAEGEPFTQRFSDILIEGSTTLLPAWRLDAAMQYSTDTARPIRSILGVRYSPQPFHTVSATYRLARGLSEQLEMGWQWPLYKGKASDATTSRCRGTLYGVGRLNYSLRDSRITDSVAGLEYDAGCWIARIVAERLSTGRSEANTRLHLQLELVGLSRLGSNPLKTLKDNIPGYQLLREARSRETRATPIDD